MTEPTAELVAQAMREGPDLAEFCSDYVQMLREAGDPPRSGNSPEWRASLVEEIAEAWAERATPPTASDLVYQDVVDSVKPQIEYYL